MVARIKVHSAKRRAELWRAVSGLTVPGLAAVEWR